MAIRVINLTHQVLSVPGPVNDILQEREVKDYEFIEWDEALNTQAVKDLIDKNLISIANLDPIPPGALDDLQKAYDNSPSGNRTISLAAGAGEGVNIRDNAAPIGTSLFEVTDSGGTPYLRSEAGHNFLSNYTTFVSPLVVQGGVIFDNTVWGAAIELSKTQPVAAPFATGSVIQAISNTAGTGSVGMLCAAQTAPGLSQAGSGTIGMWNYAELLGTGNASSAIATQSAAWCRDGSANLVIGGQYLSGGTGAPGGVAVTKAIGFDAGVRSDTASNIVDGYCFQSNAYTFTGGTITNLAGVNVDDLVQGTNNTNVLIGTQVIPAGNYSIYNSSTRLNYFAGPLDLANSLQLPTNATAINYTILDTDGYYTVLGTGGAGGIQIDLPLAANNPGRVIVVKKVDAGVGAVTVATQGADSIDGAANQPIAAQWDKLMTQSDGTNWYVIA
jgi:hypothetical protein